jgi:hypothetical protein
MQVGQLGEVDLQVGSVLATRDFSDVEDNEIAHPHHNVLGIGISDTFTVELTTTDFLQQIMELLLDYDRIK